MPKKKARGELLHWLTAKPDRRESKFIQVGETLLQHEKFHSLSASAKHLYLCMAMECGNRTQFPFTFVIASNKYGIPKPTYLRKIEELEKAGFIVKHKGYFMHANEYELRGIWKEWK